MKSIQQQTEKLIWLDGHVSTISFEESYRRTRTVITDNGCEYRMFYGDSDFVFRGGCWMEIENAFSMNL